MTKERIRYFRSLSLETICELRAKDFMESELEELIADTPMRDDEKRFCLYFHIKKMTIEEISEKLNISVSTAKRMRKRTSIMLRDTVIKKCAFIKLDEEEDYI